MARAVVLALALEVGFAGRTLDLPFAAVPLVQDAAPLMPSVAAGLVGFTVLRVMPELETVGRRALRRRRLWWALLLTLLVGAAGLAATLPADRVYLLVMPRNAACFAGVSLLGAVLLGARLAWLPVVLLAVLTFFNGRNRYDGSLHAWAWLLKPGGDAVAGLVCGGLALAGVFLYAVCDSRRTAGLPEAL